jgi:hypothetical protein
MRLELVETTFPTMDKVRGTMNVLQDAIRAGGLEIVTSVVIVKDETGALGYVGSSDLAAGDQSVKTEAVLASDPRLSRINAQSLTADIPNSSFILMIVVEDTQLTPLLKVLTGAKVAARVFDLDTPGHAPLSVASDGQRVAQPAMPPAAAAVSDDNQPPAASGELASESLFSVATGR